MLMDGILAPMEWGHLPYRQSIFEDYIGIRGLEKEGRKKWRKLVADVVKRLIAALEPDEVVLGGGNVHRLKVLPPGCRAGDNDNAFLGGFRLWPEAGNCQYSTRPGPRLNQRRQTKAVVRNKTKNDRYENHYQTTHPTLGLESPRHALQTNSKTAPPKTVC
jgi:hypothetical protein